MAADHLRPSGVRYLLITIVIAVLPRRRIEALLLPSYNNGKMHVDSDNDKDSNSDTTKDEDSDSYS